MRFHNWEAMTVEDVFVEYLEPIEDTKPWNGWSRVWYDGKIYITHDDDLYHYYEQNVL